MIPLSNRLYEISLNYEAETSPSLRNACANNWAVSYIPGLKVFSYTNFTKRVLGMVSTRETWEVWHEEPQAVRPSLREGISLQLYHN